MSCSPVLPGAVAGALATAAVLAGVAAAPAGTSAVTSTSFEAAVPTAVGDALWTPLDDAQAAQGRAALRAVGARTRVSPDRAAAYRLDVAGLADRLRRAPAETTAGPGLLLSIPSPDGALVDFRVTDSPVMEPGLAARHPEIRTYAGTTTDDFAPAGIRLDLTPTGFHAAVRGPAGAAWYVDPAHQVLRGTLGADRVPYLSYRGSALPVEQQHPDVVHGLPERPPAARAAGATSPADDVLAVEHTYRLAVITDPAYARYFARDPGGTGADAIVTAEKVTMVNRMTQVYRDDAGIRFLLVDATDETNLNTAAEMYEAGGPCGPVACFPGSVRTEACDVALDRNTFVAGTIVGAEDYDVGHLVLGLPGNGGVAYGSVVGMADKAAGCSSLGTPDGDAMAVGYVAHEVGHQFGAGHTLSSRDSTCADQLAPSTAVEPGSGNTIMSYAGLCGSDDTQPFEDPYFSQASLAQIATTVGRTERVTRPRHRFVLTGLDAGESFRLRYGSAVTATLGTEDLTAERIAAAIRGALGGAWEADVVGPDGDGDPGIDGFVVQYNQLKPVATPVVEAVAGGLAGEVQQLVVGGPVTQGGVESTPGNRVPALTTPAARTIPIRTPFALTGSATDADGDRLVYSWEQDDPTTSTGGSFLVDNAKTSGPLFRVFGVYADVSRAEALQYGSPAKNAPGTSPTRVFPDLAQVAAGQTNAATGRCPSASRAEALPAGAALNCFSEFLPTAPRTLNFRLTVRDLAGGVAFGDTQLQVSPLGPFLVTSQPKPTTAKAGGRATITWTRGLGSLARTVRITFSTDGGRTFPRVLVASTANDGSAPVRWPAVATTRGRVRVEAVDNYFFDLNDAAVELTR